MRASPTEKYLPRGKGDAYPRGVAEAIGSLDAIARADPTGLAGHLLELISLLSPQGVARELLYLGPSAGVFTAATEAASPPAIEENRDQVRLFVQHVAALTRHATSGPVYRGPDPAMTEALAVRLFSLRTWALGFLNLAGASLLIRSVCSGQLTRTR